MRRLVPFFARDFRWLGAVPMVSLSLLLVFSGAVTALRRPDSTAVSSGSLASSVRFSPDPIQIGLGSTRNIDIVVDSVEGLFAVEIRVAFPSTLAQVVDADPSVSGVQIRPGNIFAGLDTFTVQNSVNNSLGQIEYIVSVVGSEVGKDGGGVIATIPLRGVAGGSGVMSFIEVILCERDGTGIPTTYRDSQLNITVVNPTLTPTPTLPGGPTQTPTFTPPPGSTPTVTPTPITTATVCAIPAVQQIIVGDTGIVQVKIGNVCDLYGFDVRVDFNGARLDVEDADASRTGTQVYLGDVFDHLPHEVLQNEVTDDGLFGQVHVVAYVNGGVPQGFCGTGIMFWIVFRGVSAGFSCATLSEVIIVDHSGTGMFRQLCHGQIDVLPSSPTATPSVTTVSTLTPQVTNTRTHTPTPSPTGTLPTSTPTYTGTPATNTPTFSPTPTNTAVLVTPTPVCADRIVNGSFENLSGIEAPPWVRSGNTNFSTEERRTGARSAWLGGYNNASDTLYQEVSIPSLSGPGGQVTQVTLNFWWAGITQEIAHPFDFMHVRIRDANGFELQDLVAINDGGANMIWQEAMFDLSAYAGRTIRICFEVTTNATNLTSFFVDDVSLIICQIVEPTPTYTPSLSPTISPTPSITGEPTSTPTITPTPIVEIFQYREGGYEGCIDSYLDQWQQSGNFGHTGALSIRTSGMKRPLIQFDLSHIPAGVTIVDARLWLYTSHYKSHTASMTVEAYGLKQPWVEMETTWELVKRGLAWGDPGADDTLVDRDDTPSGARAISATNTWYDLELTSLVQDWVNGTRPNYGALLIATGNTVEMSFWSSEYSLKDLRPKLVVQYVFGELAPTNTPGPSPTGVASTATPTPTRSGTEMIFQQGYLGYTGTTDTHISVWERTTNFGGNVTLFIRQGDVRSALLRFDLSALPAGVTIQEAKLGLYSLDRSNPNPLTISVYKVLRPWAESQATWDLATSSAGWGAPGCNLANVDRAATPSTAKVVNSVNDWHEWDVTSLVRSWAANPSTNRGMILKGDGLTSVEYSYASSEYWWGYSLSPKLVVRYTTP
jgi:hypothetical protein